MTDSILLEAFRDVLNSLLPGWTADRSGIVGPEGALVHFGQRHESVNPGHVDVEFRTDGSKPGLWDCVSGFGDTDLRRAESAAAIWGQTTAGTLLEHKYSGQGRFADHYLGADAGGFTGWHCIAGGIIGFGTGDSAARLQQWWLAHPFLPTLAGVLEPELLEQECPYGLKILFGGEDIAEVRVNGECHESASKALAELKWPRLKPAGFVRSYVLVLHSDREGAVPKQTLLHRLVAGRVGK